MKNTKRNCSWLALLPIILLLIFGCGEESPDGSQAKGEEKAVPQFDGTIVAVGDSLTEGLGLEEEFAYPAVLEKKLKKAGYPYKVVNAGVSGETSSGTLSRIKWILTLKPDIVILVIGANDGFRGIDPGLVKSNIQKIVKLLKENNVIVVLGGMQIVQNLGRDYVTAFAELYPQVARSEDLILIPFFLEDVAADKELNQPDGIHPTAAGYQVIVDNITPYVREAIEAHRKKSAAK
jgi:acyl-CoA thioesterase-1